MAIYEKYLEDFEKRLDIDVEETLIASWKSFLDDKVSSEVFRPRRLKNSPAKIKWPEIRVNEALDSFDKMLIQQYAMLSDILEKGSGQMLAVRSNYGSSILPSLFGPKDFIMDDKLNTLPTSEPLIGGKDIIRKLIKAGVPDLNKGWGEKVFEMGKRFLEIAGQYPKIGKYVYIYHPDLQGPMDVAEVLWGSNIFVDIIDEPNLVKEFLSLITDTYIVFMEKWNQLIPPFRYSGYTVHWQFMQKGSIMLRDDSAMNFSCEMFEEFIKPYNQRLLNEFNGGAMHFCGRGDHFITSAGKMNNLLGINISQPEYNNMETIYQNTIDKGIFILGIPQMATKEAKEKNRKLRGRLVESDFGFKADG